MLESNCTAGKAVKLLARFSEAVYTFTEISGIEKKRIKAFGVPLRRTIVLSKPIPKKEHTVTILVIGGSLGARCINQAIVDSLEYLHEFRNMLRFIHIAGSEAEQVKASYKKNQMQADVHIFHHEIEKLYSQANLVICRAGGGTIAEITAVGLPAILIPFANAAENHQHMNALHLCNAGAGLILAEKDLTGETLSKMMTELLIDQKKLAQMAISSQMLGKVDASAKIALDIFKIPGLSIS